MSARPFEGDPKSPRAERTVDDALITGAVDENGRSRVPSPCGEVVLRSAEVAGAFFAGGRHELDGTIGAKTLTVYFAGEGEHDRESASVVIDSRSVEARAVAANIEFGAAREHRIEVGANGDCGTFCLSGTTPDHVTGPVGLDVHQAKGFESTRDVRAPLGLVAGWSGNSRKGDLRLHERRIMQRHSTVRTGEPGMHIGRERRAGVILHVEELGADSRAGQVLDSAA